MESRNRREVKLNTCALFQLKLGLVVVDLVNAEHVGVRHLERNLNRSSITHSAARLNRPVLWPRASGSRREFLFSRVRVSFMHKSHGECSRNIV